MWGSRLRMLENLATERGRREELTRRADVQQTTITFLCARINQLETERVLLLRQITNIDLPVPVFRVTSVSEPAPTATATTDPLEAISALGIFEDDHAHAPAGWNADGTVNYGHLAGHAVK